MGSSQIVRELMPARALVRATAVRVAILTVLLAAVAAGAQFASSRHGNHRLRAEPAPTWMERLALVDEAIDRRDVSRALYQWRDAYGEALRTRSWQPLLAAGDRAARIDALLAGHFRPEARSAYLAALFSARRERSAEGALGAAAALERLGDVEAATAARRMVPPLVSVSRGTPSTVAVSTPSPGTAAESPERTPPETLTPR